MPTPLTHQHSRRAALLSLVLSLGTLGALPSPVFAWASQESGAAQPFKLASDTPPDGGIRLGYPADCYTNAAGANSRAGVDIGYLDAPAYRVEVDQTGIQEIAYWDLDAAGIPVAVDPGIDPASFELFNLGAEVAIWVEGGGDGTFDPGDAILFFGQQLDTRYTGTNVYWLTYGKEAGLRMPVRDGTPSGPAPVPTSFAATCHREENRDRNPRIRMTPEGDNWWWKQVLAPSPDSSQAFTFTLNHPASEAYSATLRTDLHGRLYSDGVDPDHHAQVFLNRYLVDDVWWDGFEDHASEVSFPSTYLVAGTNVITITGPNDTGLGYDAFYVNWFDVDLRAAYEAEDDILAFSGDAAGTWRYEVDGFSGPGVDLFDVTDPFRVTRILSATALGSGGSYTLTFEDAITQTTRYLALAPERRLSPATIELDSPSDLRSAGNGADYIAISHGDFITEVQPLVNHRSQQGLRSVVVDVQDVYDEFSYGVFDPQAIQLFLAYAKGGWIPPAPTYVLLVGNGHYDYRGYTSGEPNYIPPHMLYMDRDLGEVAADNRYVTLTGDDILPDMHIGRLPVSSPLETAVVVDKIVAYEQNPPPGDWNWRGVFVADNVPDEAGAFVDDTRALVQHYFPGSYAAREIYLNDYCGGPQSVPTPCPAATGPITSAISDGALLVNYIGHGARDRWAHERVFDTSHVPGLNNGGRLPVFLAMTCLTGDFSVPEQVCLEGALLRAEGGGSIASWACTAEAESAGHRYLNRRFFTAVFYEGVAEIGRAATLGKQHLYHSTDQYRSLVDTYSLFGDPATRLNVPLSLTHRAHLPLVSWGD